MRFLSKLLFAPVVAVLAVFVWLCGGILYCASWVFGLASALVSILGVAVLVTYSVCLLYTSPSPRDTERSRMPSSA